MSLPQIPAIQGFRHIRKVRVFQGAHIPPNLLTSSPMYGFIRLRNVLATTEAIIFRFPRPNPPPLVPEIVDHVRAPRQSNKDRGQSACPYISNPIIISDSGWLCTSFLGFSN